MLTANEYLDLGIDDYVFECSPESCSGNSCFTDCTDFASDEDFIQQLSSDLDIPFLLNTGQSQMNLLDSFLVKSPEQIMSETFSHSSPGDLFDDIAAENFSDLKPVEDLCSEIKIEHSDSGTCSSAASNKSISPVPDCIKFFEIKDELKNEPHSPAAVHTPPDTDQPVCVANSHVRIVPNPVVAKKVPIQPKLATAAPSNKVVLLKSSDYKRSAPAPAPPVVSPQKVVMLENLATVPALGSAGVLGVVKGGNLGLNLGGGIDPRILKRHQRKIKNRESACLSRKKKKDYLTALETDVKMLTNENHQLKLENQQLKERLAKYEGVPNSVQKGSSNVKANVVLFMFLFSVAIHLDYVRNPWLSKSRTNLIQADLPKLSDHHGRTLLWSPDGILDTNGSNFSPYSMCPASINQSESARLALELERWIGIPKETSKGPSAPNVTRVSVATTTKSKSQRKRKLKRVQPTFFSSVYDSHSVGKKIAGESNNELQVFSPTPEQRYSEFFEAINRQDDTFYVVSFSDLHMLLPALHHNKTRRPKMSLIMPSVLPNENVTQPAFVPLMQIDCEVLDTRLIQVRYGSIPHHLRRQGNSTTYQKSESVSKKKDPVGNYTKRKAYKPYFIKPQSVRSREEAEFYNIR